MRQHLTRLRLISAFVVALVVNPAFAGFAAAAACPGDDMPCCSHHDGAATVNAGCCRIEPAPAPVPVPLRAPTPDRSAGSMAALPATLRVPLIVDRPDHALAARGPSSPATPLYLSLSALRR